MRWLLACLLLVLAGCEGVYRHSEPIMFQYSMQALECQEVEIVVTGGANRRAGKTQTLQKQQETLTE
jgi:hypothetical protein